MMGSDEVCMEPFGGWAARQVLIGFEPRPRLQRMGSSTEPNHDFYRQLAGITAPDEITGNILKVKDMMENPILLLTQII